VNHFRTSGPPPPPHKFCALATNLQQNFYYLFSLRLDVVSTI